MHRVSNPSGISSIAMRGADAETHSDAIPTQSISIPVGATLAVARNADPNTAVRTRISERGQGQALPLRDAPTHPTNHPNHTNHGSDNAEGVYSPEGKISPAGNPLQNHPILRMIEEEALAYRAQAAMNRKMSLPMLGLGLQYMLIAPTPTAPAAMNNASAHAGNAASMNGKDMLMPMLSLTLPIYRGKYKAQQREAAFLEEAALEKLADARLRLEADRLRLLNDLQKAARAVALSRQKAATAQTLFDLALQTFSSGSGDLADVLQIQRQLIDFRLQTAQAIADYNIQAATLQKLLSFNE
jgi:outer membrane protein TolC